MSGLRQRAGFVAARIAESFEVPLEEAADFVKRTLVNWEDFFAGKSLSHVLVYYQPRFKRTEVRKRCCDRYRHLGLGFSGGALLCSVARSRTLGR